MCDDKRTTYQPTKEELSCPRCGAECGTFCIDESTCEVCDGYYTHQNEVWRCCGKLPDGQRCDFEITGRALAARITKAKDLVSCPTCNGRGKVAKIRESATRRPPTGD